MGELFFGRKLAPQNIDAIYLYYKCVRTLIHATDAYTLYYLYFKLYYLKKYDHLLVNVTL